MTRVLLVEDDLTVRAVIEMLLELEPGLELVGTTASAEEALRLAPTLRPHVVLLDNQLEGRLTGLEAAPLLKQAHPGCVILLCTALDVEEQARSLPSIDGYLRKEGLIDLVETIEDLLRTS